MLGSFYRDKGRFATTHVLSLKEPTLSCNQVRVFGPGKALPSIATSVNWLTKQTVTDLDSSKSNRWLRVAIVRYAWPTRDARPRIVGTREAFCLRDARGNSEEDRGPRFRVRALGSVSRDESADLGNRSLDYRHSDRGNAAHRSGHHH